VAIKSWHMRVIQTSPESIELNHVAACKIVIAFVQLPFS
jgi:hypothetical protein